jgi:hypothetical protein
MASQEIELLQARIAALPNDADGVDIVKALSDIADALATLDDKLATAIESIESIEEPPPPA